MKKARNKKGLTILMCLVVIAVVLTCTPGMALRTSSLVYDMGSAFTMEFEKVIDLDKNRTLYRITENVPVEKSTQGELTTWQVYHFGPFNFAKYYGEG